MRDSDADYGYGIRYTVYGLRYGYTSRAQNIVIYCWILFLIGLLFDWISILVLVFGWVWKREGGKAENARSDA